MRQLSCVLHVGTYKTGSTSLQQQLYRNRDELLRQGIFVPTELGGGSMRLLAAFAYSHTDAPHSSRQLLKKHGGLPGVADVIRRELNHARLCGADRVFLSCEALGDLQDILAWNALRDLLSQEAVEVSVLIVCLRGQHARFLSGLSESCRNGRNLGDVGAMLPHWPYRSAWNYTSVLDPIAEAFGRDKLRVINFDRQRHELLPLIYELADIQSSCLQEVPYRNKGYSPAGRLVYSTINRLLSDLCRAAGERSTLAAPKGSATLERWRSPGKIKARREVLDQLLITQSGTAKYLRHELLAAKKLETTFCEENELLRKSYFPCQEFPLFRPLQMKALEADRAELRQQLESIVPGVVECKSQCLADLNLKKVLKALMDEWA